MDDSKRADELRDSMNYSERILSIIKSLGSSGGIASLILGPILVVFNLRLWNLPDTPIGTLLDSAVNDETVILGFCLFAIGIAVRTGQSKKRVVSQLTGIKDLLDMDLIDSGLAKASSVISMAQKLGVDPLALINLHFNEFLTYAAHTTDIDRKDLKTFEKTWKAFIAPPLSKEAKMEEKKPQNDYESPTE